MVKDIDQKEILSQFVVSENHHDHLYDQRNQGGEKAGYKNSPQKIKEVDTLGLDHGKPIEYKKRQDKDGEDDPWNDGAYSGVNIVEGAEQNEKIQHHQGNPAYRSQKRTDP